MSRRRKRNKPAKHTEGRELLLAHLAKGSQGALARALGIAQQSISQWAKGIARPAPQHREALERIARIPASAWYTADERAIANGDVKATGTDG